MGSRIERAIESYLNGEGTSNLPRPQSRLEELIYRLLENSGSTSAPIAIDLSGFETEGKIVETMPDGTTKTTTVEFDADGNIIKITDADGNETALVW